MRTLPAALLIVALLVSSLAPFAPSALAQGAAEPGSLRAMLEQTPLVGLGGETTGQVTYANLALQAETIGVEAPADNEDPEATFAWLAAFGTMVIHSQAHYLLQPEWEESLGFSLLDLDQVVEFSAPPESFALFRGRFDDDELTRRWQDAGYQAREIETGTYYTIGGDFEVDFESEISRMVFAAANYVALLAPDTIAFAATEALITEAVNLAAGNGTSFADDINVASMLEGAPNSLVSGLMIPGSQLLAIGDPAAFLTADPAEVDAIATRLAEEAVAAAEMPPLSLVLLGATAGGPIGIGEATPVAGVADAHALAVVVTSNDAAAWTLAEVIDRRLASGGAATWTEFFPSWVISVVEEEPVVVVELALAPDVRSWILVQMLYRRELGFLTWLP